MLSFYLSFENLYLIIFDSVSNQQTESYGSVWNDGPTVRVVKKKSSTQKSKNRVHRVVSGGEDWNVPECKYYPIAYHINIAIKKSQSKHKHKTFKYKESKNNNPNDSDNDINELFKEFVEEADNSKAETAIQLTEKVQKKGSKKVKAMDSIAIEHLDSRFEEGKANASVSDSIYAEIDNMLLESQSRMSSSNMLKALDKKSLMLNSKMHPNNIAILQHKDTNESSDLERLASMILRDNSHRIRGDNPVMEPTHNNDENTTFDVPNQIEHILYKENLENQPDPSVLRKRKAASEYTPYGVYSKEQGGLSKNLKYYVKANLMYYGKYDKRLSAKIIGSPAIKITTFKYLKVDNEVIIVGFHNGYILACPITDDVTYKNTSSVELAHFPFNSLTPNITSYPCGKREYELENWLTFGKQIGPISKLRLSKFKRQLLSKDTKVM